MAVVNRTPRDIGDLFNQVTRRLDNLERRGRGFTIPEVTGGTTYASDEPPTGSIPDGSLWIDTDDGNRIYRYDATEEAWIPTLDPAVDITRNQASVAIVSYMDSTGLSDGAATVFYDDGAPTAIGVGDLWVDSDDSALYRWSGLSWVNQDDVTLGAFLGHPAMTTTVADGQIKVWSQFSEPTATGFGDLWINPSQAPSTLWRWNNYDWIQVVDWSAYLAQQAISTKITTYYQTTPPISTAVGDLWFDTDDGNKQYRALSIGATTIAPGEWVLVQDASIIDAQEAADAAQDTANSKIKTFYQTGVPTATSIGDLWVDTDAGNKLYRANAIGANTIVTSGDGWYSVQDATIAEASAAAAAALDAADDALTAAEAAQAVADGAIRTWYQTDAPTGLNSTTDVGDLWFDTDNSQAYRWNGTTWVLIQDNAIATALAAAQDAQTTADGKITAFYATSAPTTGMSEGDLWYDTDNGNKVSYYDGAGWVLLPLGNEAIADGSITLPKLDLEAGDLDDIVDIGPDGSPPATAPTVVWTGGIGSVFYRWNSVANADPTEYALYVRAGSAPTTTDDTYLVAAGNILQAVVRQALGPDPDNEGGPEIILPVTPGTDYYGIVLAYDDDGKGPNSAAAVAQSVEINSPDIATDAIATRHLQADSVGLDQLQAGSIDANKLAARLVIASELLLGNVDNSGLNPAELQPNLLPPMTPEYISDDDAWPIGHWDDWHSSDGFIVSTESYNPPNDDSYWDRMAPDSLSALRVNLGTNPAGSNQDYILDTRIAVEPLTEYRFELNSAMPGMDTSMPLSAADIALRNTVRWFASTNTSVDSSEVISWKSFVRENTTRGELTKFDRGIIRTGVGQTELRIRMVVRASYLEPTAGGFLIIQPELRKMVSSTTVPLTVEQPVSIADTSDVTPDPTYTGWKASAIWLGGTSSAVRSSSIVTASSSNGTFSPSTFSTPGRYATPGSTTQSFQQARGLRITTRSAGTGLGLRARIATPGMPVPSLSPLESLMLDIGFSGINQGATALDDFKLNISWFDESNSLISVSTPINLDAAGVASWGITNLTENYFTLQLQPPVGAVNCVIWGEFSNGPSGEVSANTDYTPTLHGIRLYTLQAINYNYGNMAHQHVQIDGTGIRLMNSRGQVQVSIPTDEEETPLFRGGIEAEWARFFAGASFEGNSEVAKDATISLSDGIKSPVNIPTLSQEYEQLTLGRIPEDWDSDYNSRPTLNPSQITGAVYKENWGSGEIWAAENRGGGIAIWRFRRDGTARFATWSPGFQWAVPFHDPRTTGNLFAGEWGGNNWAYVYNGTDVILNRIPDGVVPNNVHVQYYWNTVNDRLYAFYPHIDGSGRNVYKRLRVNNTSGGTMVLEDTVVGGSGSSRTSSTGGLAGVSIIGSRIYTVARGTAAADTYVFAPGSGGALDPGARWELASSPVGFFHDGSNFWQIDTAGKLTRYSNWTWPETNHKLYAGMTWYDSDPGGTGVHETDLTALAQATLRKRISGVRVTMPRVPDKGGSDDPDKWRLYAYKGSSLGLPAGRTSLFLQSQGGSPSQETTYIIPAEGLIASGTNPPAANNFPSAGPGRLYSSRVDGSSNPLINLKGNGEADLGNFRVRSGVANIGRAQMWVTTTANSAANSTLTVRTGDWPTILGDHTANDGWTGIIYSGSGIFTCTEAGWYWVEFCYHWESGINRRLIFSYVDEASPGTGNAYRRASDYAGNAAGTGISATPQAFLSQLSFPVRLNVGQTLKFGVWQNSGGSLGATSGAIRIGGNDYTQSLYIERRG